MPTTIAPTQRLTTEQAAEYLGLAPATLSSWRVRKSDGPRFVRMGRAVRYLVSDLDEWTEANSGTRNADFATS